MKMEDVIAFANSVGGKLYVGVRDDGTIQDGEMIVAIDIHQGKNEGHFEEVRSLEQNLTFEDAKKEFSERNIPF